MEGEKEEVRLQTCFRLRPPGWRLPMSCKTNFSAPVLHSIVTEGSQCTGQAGWLKEESHREARCAGSTLGRRREAWLCYHPTSTCHLCEGEGKLHHGTITKYWVKAQPRGSSFTLVVGWFGRITPYCVSFYSGCNIRITWVVSKKTTKAPMPGTSPFQRPVRTYGVSISVKVS